MFIKLALLTLLTCCYATPPPGYVKPPDVDQNPPNYKYGYTIDDKKGSEHGKHETREGPFSLGRYYVQLGGASQNVEYFTDEWGYHPVVEYSSVNDHSQTSASFALGEKAVEALKNNRQNQQGKVDFKFDSKLKLSKPTPTPTLLSTSQPSNGGATVNQIPLTKDGNSGKLQTILLQPQFEQNVEQNTAHYIVQTPNVQPTIHPQFIYSMGSTLPQPQMLIHQNNAPQSAMLIQNQNGPQTQYLIPIYQDNAPVNYDQSNLLQLQYLQDGTQNQGKQIYVQQIQQNTEEISKDTKINQIETDLKKNDEALVNLQQEFNNAVTSNYQENVQQQNTKQAEQTVANLRGKYIVETSPSTINIQEKQNVYQQQNTQKVEQSTNDNAVVNFNGQYIVASSPSPITQNVYQEVNHQVEQQVEEQSDQQVEQVDQQNTKQEQQDINSVVDFNSQYIVASTPRPVIQNIYQQVGQQNTQQHEQQTNGNTVFNYGQYLIETSPRPVHLKGNQNIYLQVDHGKQGQSNNNYAANYRGQYIIANPVGSSYQQSQQGSHSNVYVKNNGYVHNAVTLHSNQQNQVDFTKSVTQNTANNGNYESQALFSDLDTKVKYSTSNNNQINNQKPTKQAETVVRFENQGEYGSKLNAKLTSTKPQKFDDNSQLIHRTKSLVSGADVLNINEAVSNTINNGNSGESYVEFNNNGAKYGYSNYDNGNRGLLTADTYSSSTVRIGPESTIIASRTKLTNILNAEKVNEQQNEKISFKDQPIVVADLEDYQENSIQSTTERYQENKMEENVYSTTRNTIETEINGNNFGVTDSSILITPRPIGHSFLAPITAAVSLQNSIQEHNTQEKGFKTNTVVEIQKSVPYYIGKVEFLENQQQYISAQKESEKILNYLQGSNGRNVLNIQDTQNVQVNQDEPRAESLIQHKETQESVDNIQVVDNVKVDQKTEEEQELSIHLPLRPRNQNNIVKENTDQESQRTVTVLQPYPVEVTKTVEKPIEIIKYIDRPYPYEVQVPVEVPVQVPYPVEKHIHIPYEKIVEKPVEVTRFVEKQIPVPVPQPYPVEVERIVEKQVDVPYEVTKYVDKPYPVHIHVPHPVAVPIQFNKIVEKIVKQPYRVEVPVRVEVPIKVPVPHPIHITKYVDKPYPVEKIVEKQVNVEKIIEKPVTKYINRPYPVHIRVPVPTPVAVPVEVKVPYPYPVEVPKYLNHEKPSYNPIVHYRYPFQKQLSAQSINVPVSVAPTKLHQVSFDASKFKSQHIDTFDSYSPYFNLHQQKFVSNPYLYAPKYQPHWSNTNCDFHVSASSNLRNSKSINFVGLVPPLPPHKVFNRQSVETRNYKRRPRQSFGGNLRVEYGFKPPLIPSVETDENGTPIEKDE